MVNVDNIISELGGPAVVGRLLNKRPSVVSQMIRTNSIRATYWAHLVEHAAESGFEGITFEVLADIHDYRKPSNTEGS